MLQAPFPWFGGKATVADEVWRRFGNVRNYVEPFFGSGAVLLRRPNPSGTETVSDADGFVANFWRAVAADPEAVAHHADWPVNEHDLQARHYWLVTHGRERLAEIMPDPSGCDAQIAGWWCWGLSAWIGGGWCAGDGPWRIEAGRWVRGGAKGINRQLPHLTGAQGINRQLPHLTGARGINRQLPHLTGARGINRQLPHLTGAKGEWIAALAERLRDVRICHGDWSRITGDSVTWRNGLSGVFLDPPYADDEHAITYGGGGNVAAETYAWAVEAGKRPDMRVALCGYDLPTPDGWSAYRWKARGGYANQGDKRGRVNASREVILFSPACIPSDTPVQGVML